jgi:trehalose utilization protein
MLKNDHNEKIRNRLARASFRLKMAELERLWAIVTAHPLVNSQS